MISSLSRLAGCYSLFDLEDNDQIEIRLPTPVAHYTGPVNPILAVNTSPGNYAEGKQSKGASKQLHINLL